MFKFCKDKEISEGNCGVFNFTKQSYEKSSLISALPSKKWLNKKTFALYYVK